jgi:hypothetical protein
VPRVVHVLVGASAAASFRRTKIAPDLNDMFVLRDPLSCGPLLPIAEVRSWTEQRNAYWGDLLGVAADAGENLCSNPQALQTGDEIVLWLGTDLTDQIVLAWLPVFLRALDVQEPRLKIVQLQRSVDGIEVSHLGMLYPSEIAAHPAPVPLSVDNIHELESVWDALTSAEPDALFACSRRNWEPFPFLTGALRDAVKRYPEAVSGLNTWEMTLLRNAQNERRCHRVIAQTLADGIRALKAGTGGHDQVGDSWLYDRMVRLADSKLRAPALEITGSRAEYHDSQVCLTPFGRGILDGQANFIDANGINDWVFGVHLHSDAGRVWFHHDGELTRR